MEPDPVCRLSYDFGLVALSHANAIRYLLHTCPKTEYLTVTAEKVERAEGLVWRYDVGDQKGVSRFSADDLLERFTIVRDAELYGRLCELARWGFVVHVQRDGTYAAHTPDRDSSFNCISCGFFGDEFTNLPEPVTNLRYCECEHSSHFEDEPGGLPAIHPYLRVEASTVVSTPYGTFNWCSDCVQAHNWPAPEVQA